MQPQTGYLVIHIHLVDADICSYEYSTSADAITKQARIERLHPWYVLRSNLL